MDAEEGRVERLVALLADRDRQLADRLALADLEDRLDRAAVVVEDLTQQVAAADAARAEMGALAESEHARADAEQQRADAERARADAAEAALAAAPVASPKGPAATAVTRVTQAVRGRRR